MASLVFPFLVSNVAILLFRRTFPASCHIFVELPLDLKYLDHTVLG